MLDPQTLLLCLSFIVLGPTLVHSQTPSPDPSPTWVYRAEGLLLRPSDLKNQGGFLARGKYEKKYNFNLLDHVKGLETGMSSPDTAYISTSKDLHSAQRFLKESLTGNGYIYKIHVTPNFIDVATTLGDEYARTGHVLEKRFRLSYA